MVTKLKRIQKLKWIRRLWNQLLPVPRMKRDWQCDIYELTDKTDSVYDKHYCGLSLSLSDTRLYFGSPTVKLSLSELSECQPKEVCDEGMEWNVKCGCLVLCQLKLSVVKN